MTYSEVMLNSMTADELIRGLENGTIESLSAEMVLRIIKNLYKNLYKQEDREAAYDEGFEDGKIEGRDEAIKEAIHILEGM